MRTSTSKSGSTRANRESRQCFTEFVAWTQTTNGPTGADVYRLAPKEGGYLLDGRTKSFDVEKQIIKIRQADGTLRDEPLTKCPKCKKSGVKRLVGGGAGLIFKGSGFYSTDYGRGSRKTDDPKDGDGPSEGVKKDEKKGEKKDKSPDKKPAET